MVTRWATGMAFADNATAGAWEDNGEQRWPRRKGGMKPEAPVRNIEGI